MTKPLYALLGIEETATPEEVKRAYRTKAKDCHPDKPENRDDPAKAEMWTAIKTAYDTLIDPEARKHYDSTGEVKIDQADKVTARALKAVINHFMRAINEDGVNVDNHDLIEQAKVYAKEDMGKVEANIAEVKRQMAKYRKVQARLKLKAGQAEDPLSTALRTTIKEGEDVLKEQEINRETVNRMLEILDRYDYDHIVSASGGMSDGGIAIAPGVRFVYVGNGGMGNSSSGR